MTKHDEHDGMGNPVGGGSAAASEVKPQVAFTDLREWIEEAGALGEIREVKGLSWQQDIGMASELILHDENAPCVIFGEVPDTLPGSRILVNFFGGKRARMTLGFPPHLSKLELSEAFRAHYLADLKRIPPRFVNDGPIFENVITGDAVDVSIFPTPKWHEDDGGRYIGTGSFNVTRDPDEGWINCGTYRVMIHDAQDRSASTSRPASTAASSATSTWRAASRCRSRSCFGCDPLLFLWRRSEVPYGSLRVRRDRRHARRAGRRGQRRRSPACRCRPTPRS